VSVASHTIGASGVANWKATVLHLRFGVIAGCNQTSGGEMSGSRISAVDRYTEINNALINSYFTPEQAGEPVYLDMDDAVLDTVARLTGTARVDFEAELAASVRSLLALYHPGVSMFDWFDRTVMHWRAQFSRALRTSSQIPEPPIVALLAIFTMAAEHMGDSAVSDMHDSAYYPRLCRILNIPADDQGRFKTAFRKNSEGYWDVLSTWLEALDGDRGMPTAYALSHRYVGLPISQALVRDAERRQFKRMFEEMALPANSTISHSDMDSALDQWINAVPSTASANLRGLWAKTGARERLSDIALVEFDSWDGAVRQPGRSDRAENGTVRSVRLAVSEISDFFETSYSFAVVLPRTSLLETKYSLLTDSGPAAVSARQVGPSLDGVPFDGSGIDPGSALNGIIRIESGADRVATRFPRKAIPLMWDTSVNLYMETERIPVGQLSALLVQDDLGLASKAESIIRDIARPGFVRHGVSTAGIPKGWVLFTAIQAMQAPLPGAIGTGPLEILEPRLSIQMALTGGFRIPGRVTRWSLLDLPEIAVVADDASELVLEISTRDLASGAIETHEMLRGAAPLITSLIDHITTAGDYTILLSRGSTRLQSMTVRTRSSDNQDVYSWRKIGPVSHVRSDPLWPLRATKNSLDDAVIDGAFSYGEAISFDRGETTDGSTWAIRSSSSVVRELLKVPIPNETSCIQTGAHKIQLPRYEGRPEDRFITGYCTQCGISKRSPSASWDRLLRKRDDANHTPTRQVAPADLHSIGGSPRNWRPAIDTLAFLGAGSRSDLSAIARQLENSPVFEHHFIRSLESLAVLETTRDDSLDVTGFEIASTSLAQLVDRSTLLTGLWSQAGLKDALVLGRSLGANAEIVEVSTVHLSLLRGDVDEIAGEYGDGLAAHDAGQSMLTRLPHIGTLFENLKAVPNPLMPGKTEVFSPVDNRWYPDPKGGGSNGAYRRRHIGGTDYVVRFGDDLSDGTARRVQVDLAKYLAAWNARRSLVRYNPVTARLSVPLGAPLPGLYERAAVLCSGELPLADRESWSLHYDEIPEAFAEQLIARLT
jgi:hypothetical protein